MGMWHAWGRGEVCTGFWWGDLKERDHLEGLGVDGRKMLKIDPKEEGCWQCMG